MMCGVYIFPVERVEVPVEEVGPSTTPPLLHLPPLPLYDINQLASEVCTF